MASKDRDAEHVDQPVYWFVILDAARDRGDFETAAEAKRQLERLGVRVTFRRQRREVVTR